MWPALLSAQSMAPGVPCYCFECKASCSASAQRGTHCSSSPMHPGEERDQAVLFQVDLNNPRVSFSHIIDKVVSNDVSVDLGVISDGQISSDIASVIAGQLV